LTRRSARAVFLDKGWTPLSALLLVVALPHFTFRGQPILGFAAGCGPALLVKFVSAAPDLIFQFDGNNVFSDLGLSDLELPG
jgi:hypothetical protein